MNCILYVYSLLRSFLLHVSEFSRDYCRVKNIRNQKPISCEMLELALKNHIGKDIANFLCQQYMKCKYCSTIVTFSMRQKYNNLPNDVCRRHLYLISNNFT